MKLKHQLVQYLQFFPMEKGKSDVQMVHFAPGMSMIVKSANLHHCSDGHYGLEMQLNRGMIPG